MKNITPVQPKLPKPGDTWRAKNDGRDVSIILLARGHVTYINNKTGKRCTSIISGFITRYFFLSEIKKKPLKKTRPRKSKVPKEQLKFWGIL